MSNVIEVTNLSKNFGEIKAVDNISFAIEKGEIFGFLGPNGAGKTTTIRCLMDFIRPSSGNISIMGFDSQKDSARIKKQIGYLSGNVKLYNGWTGKEHFAFLESIRGKSKNLKELIEKLDFNPRLKAGHLSSGNRQKLGLILALMHEPEVIIMDEPTVGLDPLLQNVIYEILEEFQKQGKTIFMSSHNLPEVERLCRRVGIIRAGKLVAVENISDLHAKKMHHIAIQYDGNFQKTDFKIPGVEVEEVLSDSIILAAKGDINPVIAKIAKQKITDIEITHATLEEVFLEFYKKEGKK